MIKNENPITSNSSLSLRFCCFFKISSSLSYSSLRLHISLRNCSFSLRSFLMSFWPEITIHILECFGATYNRELPSEILLYLRARPRRLGRFVSLFFSRKSLNHHPVRGVSNTRLLSIRVAPIGTIDHWSTWQQSPPEEPASSLTLRPFMRQGVGDKLPKLGLPIT